MRPRSSMITQGVSNFAAPIAVAFAVLLVYAAVYGISRLSDGVAEIPLTLFATALVAIGAPKLAGFARAKSHSFFRGGADPRHLLAETLERLKDASEHEALLTEFAARLRAVFGARGCEIWFRVASHDVLAASSGLKFDSDEAGEQVDIAVMQGELEVGSVVLFRPSTSPTPTERRFIGQLAYQIGLAWQNVQLGSELRRQLTEVRARSDRIVQTRREIVRAQEEERRRLKRDLHDGAQQYLVGLGLRLQLAAQLSVDDPEAASLSLRDALDLTNQAIRSLDSLFTESAWEELVEEGLADALKVAAERLGLSPHVMASLERQPLEIQIPIFLTCLEALQNVAKHSTAPRVALHLFEEDGYAAFSVRDSGIGFDLSTTAQSGLKNMQERMTRAGGDVRIQSEIGKGTSVIGRIPLSSRVG